MREFRKKMLAPQSGAMVGIDVVQTFLHQFCAALSGDTFEKWRQDMEYFLIEEVEDHNAAAEME